jgi:sRNA-binding carbon storage regulator CsrA
MLVLTRKAEQSLVIFPMADIPESMTVRELFCSGPIRILLHSATGDIKLGIEAPAELTILREELIK